MINIISLRICLTAIAQLISYCYRRKSNRTFFFFFLYISTLTLLFNWTEKWYILSYQIRRVKNDIVLSSNFNRGNIWQYEKNVNKGFAHFKRTRTVKDVDPTTSKCNDIGSRVACEKKKIEIRENEKNRNKEMLEKKEGKEGKEKGKNEVINKRKNYYNSLNTNQVINKYINESVNFTDGVSNFFVMNPTPNIFFFLEKKKMTQNKKGKDSETGVDSSKEKGKQIEKIGNTKEMEQVQKDALNGNDIQNAQKQKICLKLKRGYMNEIYKKEKEKLNEILFHQTDKSIFKKKKKKLKENILLLNGQVVKVEKIKQYVFNKLRLEYYENIRDQKKILTLDMWAKEINISVDSLKELILYIHKMKNLVQKEDEEMLIKTYFYNKNNMFTLFRNKEPGKNVNLSECEIPTVEENKEKEIKNINKIKPEENKKKESTKQWNLFDDNFENVETFLHSDCEKLINVQITKCIECIKDIVFFENSIYIIEKLENRPPLLEELTFAYNIEKREFINSLEKKIKLSQKLLMYFMPLIKNIIKKAETNFSSNLSEEDFLLISLDAVKNGFKKYDLQKGGIANLTKCVYMWAKNSTYSYYQKHKSLTPISTATYKDYNKIKNFQEQFFEKYNKKPSLTDISEGLNMKEEKIEKVLSSSYNVIEAEKPLVYKTDTSSSASMKSNPEKNTYTDLIVNSDDIHSFNEMVYNEIVIKGLRKFICKSIKNKQNKILIFMKFGLFLNKKNYADSEICDHLKISSAKFKKLFQNSMNEIKKFLKKCKKEKTEGDATNMDFSTYTNFSQFDFLGNEFSQFNS